MAQQKKSTLMSLRVAALSFFSRLRVGSDVELSRNEGIELSMANQTAIFGGGCFWCIEAVFDRVSGVVSVESGYTGGRSPHPTYQQVCTGTTGHVEVARITFDPAQVSFRELLDVFFAVHDPTTLNRQGNDFGTQYRSVIFYTSDEQRREAEGVIAELNASHAFPNPVVTAVEPASEFYIAENYHQEYFTNHQAAPYCSIVIAPKLRKFEKLFGNRIKAS
jgi:peptide-methionine (S)-S-oxide reductase